MKKYVLPFLVYIALFLLSPLAFSAEDPVQAQLDREMKALDLPDHAPAAMTHEKLYSVQQRYLPLENVNEISLGGGQNLSGNSFLDTWQTELSLRHHFNDRWSAGLAAAWVQNRFTDSARRLEATDGILPEVPFARERYDLTAEANLFYGKFRLTSERVFYFDQYVAFGPGLEHMNESWVGALTGDIGLAIWLGHWGSLRMGLKDYYYNETYRDETQARNNLTWHLDLGVAL